MSRWESDTGRERLRWVWARSRGRTPRRGGQSWLNTSLPDRGDPAPCLSWSLLSWELGSAWPPDSCFSPLLGSVCCSHPHWPSPELCSGCQKMSRDVPTGPWFSTLHGAHSHSVHLPPSPQGGGHLCQGWSVGRSQVLSFPWLLPHTASVLSWLFPDAPEPHHRTPTLINVLCLCAAWYSLLQLPPSQSSLSTECSFGLLPVPVSCWS